MTQHPHLSGPRRTARFAILPCAFLIASGAAGDTEEPSPSGPPPQPARSLWWSDFDGDGLDDAYVVQADGAGRLLQGLGDGRFLDVTDRALPEAVSGAHMAVWGDVDGDRRLDLFLPAWDGRSMLLTQTEDGTFVDVSEESGVPPFAAPIDASFRDLDGDGDLDLHLLTEVDDLVLVNDGRARFERLDLGLQPRVPTAGRRGAGTLEEARAARGLPPVDGPATSGPGGPGIGYEVVCAIGVQDQASPASCLNASSVPTLGMLYPLSTDLFVDAGTGHVGVGTTNPNQKLEVIGTIRASGDLRGSRGVFSADPPLAVASASVVANLNADLLDGVDASAFATLPISGTDVADGTLTAADLAFGAVGTSEIALGAVTTAGVANSTLLDEDVSAAAGIQGVKIAAQFGSQLVTGQDGAIFRDFDRTGVTGTIDIPTTRGYLAVQGTTDFDDVDSADWIGLELGAVGVSTGSTNTDNYGVMGHSNFVGVRGEHSANREVDFAELGLQGIGVRASGETSAGVFTSTIGATIVAERTDNLGNILEVGNLNDIEFLVESGGNVRCDLSFIGGGADYAEWLPLLDPSEVLMPGDVVGVHAGRVTRRVDGADQILVVSTNPCLVGNALDAETGTREAHERIAFIGQVPVHVRGPVEEGDFLIPSGLDDGVAVAVAPEALAPHQLALVLGVAWGASADEGVKDVNASVGLDQAAAAVVALQRAHARLDATERLLAELAARLEALEGR